MRIPERVVVVTHACVYYNSIHLALSNLTENMEEASKPKVEGTKAIDLIAQVNVS